MSNFYNGGSPFPTGLSRTAKTPVDTALNVETIAQRDALNAYYAVGDIVYVQSEDKHFKRTLAESWEEFNVSNSSGSFKGAINVRIDAVNNGTPNQSNPNLVEGTPSNISGVVSLGGLCEVTVDVLRVNTGDFVVIKNVVGVNGINKEWQVTVTGANTFTLNNSTFSGSYVSGGLVKEIGNAYGDTNGDFWVISSAYSDEAMQKAEDALIAINIMAAASDADALTYTQLEEAGIVFADDASGDLTAIKTAIEGEVSITTIAALATAIDPATAVTFTYEDRRNLEISGTNSFNAGDKLVTTGEGYDKYFTIIKSGETDATASLSFSQISDGENAVLNLVESNAVVQWANTGVPYSANQLVYNDETLYIDKAPALRVTNIVKGATTTITIPTHGLSTNDVIKLIEVGGMEDINNVELTVTVVDANTVTAVLDSTSFVDYTTGGKGLRQVTYRTIYQAKLAISSGGNALPAKSTLSNSQWEIIASQDINLFSRYDNEVAASGTAFNGEYLDAVAKFWDANKTKKEIQEAVGSLETGVVITRLTNAQLPSYAMGMSEVVVDWEGNKIPKMATENAQLYANAQPLDFRVDQSYSLSSFPATNIQLDFENKLWSINETFIADGDRNLVLINMINGSNFQVDFLLPKGTGDVTITIITDTNSSGIDNFELALSENDTSNTFILYGSDTVDTHHTLSGRFVPLLKSGTTITNLANNGGAIRVTAASHGLITGDRVTISGVEGTTEANSYWYVTVVDANTLDLDNSTYSNSYTGNGLIQRDFTKWWISKFEWS